MDNAYKGFSFYRSSHDIDRDVSTAHYRSSSGDDQKPAVCGRNVAIDIKVTIVRQTIKLNPLIFVLFEERPFELASLTSQPS